MVTTRKIVDNFMENHGSLISFMKSTNFESLSLRVKLQKTISTMKHVFIEWIL